MATNNRQIEFPENQTHVRAFEYGMIAIAIVCVVIVVIVVFFTNLGDEFRPTV